MIKRRGLKPSSFGTLKRKGGRVRLRSQKTKKRSKEKSISKLIKECDRLFSIKVRGIRPEHPNEYGCCYTCGHITQKKKLQCSHYLSRYYKAARWNFDNARPACFMCNIWKKGDLVNFRQRLMAEIGEARVLAVEAKRNDSIKLSRDYLKNLRISLLYE